jgi:hypothetical protein
MSDTRRGFLAKLGVGLAAAMLTANLELGQKPAPKLPEPFVNDGRTIAFFTPDPRLRFSAPKNVTFSVEHIAYWKDIPKTAAYNVVDKIVRVGRVPWWRRIFKPKARRARAVRVVPGWGPGNPRYERLG